MVKIRLNEQVYEREKERLLRIARLERSQHRKDRSYAARTPYIATDADMANYLGVRPSHFNEIKKGQRSAKKVINKLADLFGCTPGYLCGDAVYREDMNRSKVYLSVERYEKGLHDIKGIPDQIYRRQQLLAFLPIIGVTEKHDSFMGVYDVSIHDKRGKSYREYRIDDFDMEHVLAAAYDAVYQAVRNELDQIRQKQKAHPNGDSKPPTPERTAAAAMERMKEKSSTFSGKKETP